MAETDLASSPTARELIAAKAASRLHAKDASLFDFSEEAQECAQEFMGWVDLASNPPYPIDAIQALADECVGHGVRTVLLLGQGGSSQAAMTLTKYNKVDSNRVIFKTLDSDRFCRSAIRKQRWLLFRQRAVRPLNPTNI